MRYALVALLIACRASQAADDTAIDAGPDAPDGTGCTPTTPRAVEPQAFVGPTGLQTRIETLIDGAQHSLDVQMYLFTVRPIADRIVAASQRGVAVRVILDPDEAGNDAIRPTLAAANIPTANAASVYTFSHAKYLIIDRASAVIMSMNFNATAMSSERNYGFVDGDPEDVADVQAVFDQDWALAHGMSPAPPDLACTRLIISPNNSKPRILSFIAAAQHTLDVEALYVTDVNVRNAIGAAAQRGATVRVILMDPSDQPQNTDTTTFLKGLGIPVKYPGGQFYLHAKLMIADGTAFVGSENYSQTSLSANREMGALLFEPAQAAVIQQQFDADWNVTTPAP